MQILMKPIEVITKHLSDGTIRPQRIRITGQEQTVINIDKILSRSEERMAGGRILIFGCQGIMGDRMRQFELAYRTPECKWFLSRI